MLCAMVWGGGARAGESQQQESHESPSMQQAAVDPLLQSLSQTTITIQPRQPLAAPRTASDPIVSDGDVAAYSPYLDPGPAGVLAVPGGCRQRCGVQCDPSCPESNPRWRASQPIPWEVFAQGEYVGPARTAHVPVYRLRVDDMLQLVYRLSGQVSLHPYRLNVRDKIRVESLSSPQEVDRDVIIQPDGCITLRLLGQVRAAGYTIDELRQVLDDRYRTYIRNPSVTVTPLEVNSNLMELRNSVDRRAGEGGQVRPARVTPEGTIQLPALGSVPAQGLTLAELRAEVESRYSRIVDGLEVTPILTERAPRRIFVLGEVRIPGRYVLDGPTTIMGAIAMAGGWNHGGHLKEVVVFRRDNCWRLMATRVNLEKALFGRQPCPPDELWLRDSDIVLLPKSHMLKCDEDINLFFTRGIYGIIPMSYGLQYTNLSNL
jgi:polysaccharide export outer membrane protein